MTNVNAIPQLRELRSLSVLAELQHRARHAATVAELGFLMANASFSLVPYRQAVLWGDDEGVMVVSGATEVEARSPYAQYLARLCRHFSQTQEQAAPVMAEDSAEQDQVEWDAWFPPFGFWLPLTGPCGARLGALLLLRETPWETAEVASLQQVGDAYGHAWKALMKGALWPRLRKKQRLLRWLLAAAGVIALAAPVPLTVLAPAEIIPANPLIVRAPLDGVVERLHVRPNAQVAAGDPLFELDEKELRGKLEVAEKTAKTAEAELRQTAQQAVFDPEAKPKIAILRGRFGERLAEVEYLKELLARIKVSAPQGGVAILNDPSEWIGRPVSIGERVVAIAQADEVEIEAWLNVGDVVDFPVGAEVTMFLNVSPLDPLRATLRYVGYEALTRPDSSLAYRVRAVLNEGENVPRLGWKGTVRIAGDTVPLVYWLIRRPLAVIRETVGI